MRISIGGRRLSAPLIVLAGLTTSGFSGAQVAAPGSEPAKDTPEQNPATAQPASSKAEQAEEDPATRATEHPAYRDRDQGVVSPPGRARSIEQEPAVETEDILLFPARALLFVPNLALKIAFVPLRYLIGVVDEYQVIARVEDLIYFDEEHTQGIVPKVSAQTGYGFSYGAKLFDNNLLGHDESASLAGRFGGEFTQAYQLSFDGDRVGGAPVWVDTRVRYEVKPAILFHGFGDPPSGSRAATGVGPRELAVATRFRQERFLAMARIGGTAGKLGNLTQFGVTGTFNHRVFGPEEEDFSEPSIERVYDTSLIPGFDDQSVNVLEAGLSLVHDGRDNHGVAADGSYFEFLGGRALPLGEYQYWHYGGEVTSYFDLFKKNRVLVTRAALEGVSGRDDEIPFTDLPRLGGPNRLRGYLLDQFRDRLSVVTTLEYRYPIHERVAGALFVDAGRVGRDYDEVFSDPFDAWKAGVGGGFIFHSADKLNFSVEAAYGDGYTVHFSTDPLRAFQKRSRQL